MNKSEAEAIFRKFVKKNFGDVEILSVNYTNSGYLFEFCSIGDDFPIDYPVIFVSKSGETKELSFLNPEDREIIFGRA